MHIKIKIVQMFIATLIYKASLVMAFESKYPCVERNRVCIDSGTKIIDGHRVKRDCWEWSYDIICDYPSNNDCVKYDQCYSLGQKDCLLHDDFGNCVNLKKEFSCESKIPFEFNQERYREYILEKSRGSFVCLGMPCIDGNCINKSYELDNDLISSISKLRALSLGQNDNYEFKIFQGKSLHCSQKPFNYLDCCKLNSKGWGQGVGAKCTQNEKYLMQERLKNLCVYVGKNKTRGSNLYPITKRYFCCFNSILEKEIQIQARGQLGISFGDGKNPDCRGLNLEELEQIDWDKIDFSEVKSEVLKNMFSPSTTDLEIRVKNSLNNIGNFDETFKENESNKKASINHNLEAE